MNEDQDRDASSDKVNGRFVTRGERLALARRISGLRIRMGISQAELARRAFGPEGRRQLINLYEKGEIWPAHHRLDAVARALNTTAEALLDGLPTIPERRKDVEVSVDYEARVAHLKLEITLELSRALEIMAILDRGPNVKVPEGVEGHSA